MVRFFVYAKLRPCGAEVLLGSGIDFTLACFHELVEFRCSRIIYAKLLDKRYWNTIVHFIVNNSKVNLTSVQTTRRNSLAHISAK